MNHLRFLRYLDEVARCGSIRLAAERLHVAASAVNRRIQDLEEELGTPLFERLPRGMRLTAAGELFVRYIRDRSADLDEVRSRIEELKGLRRGKVRIVASQALAPAFLPRCVAQFRRQHSLVAFDVRIGDHIQALQMLRSFEADLANRTGCAVHAFDHTVDGLPAPVTGVRFNRVGLAPAEVPPALLSLPTMMAARGHDRVHLLKVDCEDCEWAVFGELARNDVVRPTWGKGHNQCDGLFRVGRPDMRRDKKT